MKKILFLAALLAASFGARAESCPPLDYEEMKEMSTKELTKTYCSYYNEFEDKLRWAIRNNFDEHELEKTKHCEGQVDRIGRILRKREDGRQAVSETCPLSLNIFDKG